VSSWPVIILGQPASGNENEVVKGYRRGRDGSTISYPRIKKSEHVATYIAGAVPIIRTARPSHWVPPDLIRVDYRLFLSRDMDWDNVFKIVNDALKLALDVDDNRFYPTPISKEIDLKNPRVWLAIGPLRRCDCCGR
jgi:Holliday junction resolvase RusA-like endonuclease